MQSSNQDYTIYRDARLRGGSGADRVDEMGAASITFDSLSEHPRSHDGYVYSGILPRFYTRSHCHSHCRYQSGPYVGTGRCYFILSFSGTTRSRNRTPGHQQYPAGDERQYSGNQCCGICRHDLWGALYGRIKTEEYSAQ